MAGKVFIPVTPSGGLGPLEAFDDLASDIASPPTNRPIRRAIATAGQKYCDFLGAVPGAGSGFLGPGFVAGSLLCKPYWDSKGYSAPSTSPPFTGGQCAVSYRCPVIRGAPNNSTSNPASFANITGPVISQSISFIGNFQWRMVIKANNAVPNGELVHIQNVLANEAPPRFGALVRLDGQPDNCGNLPGDVFPGANPPPTPSFPSGEEPGGQPTEQPFFRVPDLPSPVTGEDPIPVPDVPVPDGDGGADGGGPTSPPSAGEEQEGANGDEEFPPPPDGERWVGVCIRLTTVPQGTGVVPGTSPETILTQVVGNARLLFDSVTGDGYDTPVQIRSAGLCLWEPIRGLSPKGVRVNLKPGFEYSYTPYSIPEEE